MKGSPDQIKKTPETNAETGGKARRGMCARGTIARNRGVFPCAFNQGGAGGLVRMKGSPDQIKKTPEANAETGGKARRGMCARGTIAVPLARFIRAETSGLLK